MKKLTVLLFSILVISVSCEKNTLNPDFFDDTAIEKINGTWKVVSFEDFTSNTVIRKEDVESYGGMDIILTFTKDTIFSGINTATPVSGKYKLSGRNIEITQYVENDDVILPEWGSKFAAAVLKSETFRINESQMRFYYNNSKKSITFDRQ